MRRTVISLVAVGALVFAGCSDSDNDPESDSDDTSAAEDSGGGSEGGGEAAGSEFCTTFEELINGGQSVEDSEVLEQIQSIEPPEEIADDYATFVEFVELNTNIDPSDSSAVEDMQSRQEEFTSASTAVETYVRDECGIDTTGGSDTTDAAGDDGATSDTTADG
jgi:hypothetical protein